MLTTESEKATPCNVKGICGEVFCVLAPLTASDKILIYGRNGLRAASGEILLCPASEASDGGPVKCDSAEVDSAAAFSVILAKQAGLWGAETGSNEKGLCVGLTFSEGGRQTDRD